MCFLEIWRVSDIKYYVSLHVLYWREFRNLAESSWSSEGVRTEVTSQNEEKGTFDVVCKSNHLTSFAVLLDINNALSVSSCIF